MVVEGWEGVGGADLVWAKLTMFMCIFEASGEGGDDQAAQGGAQGGGQSGEGGAGQALERMMEMMRLKGEPLQLPPASTSGLRKEVEDLRSGKGQEQQHEEKEETIPLLSLASVEKMQSAPHLPGWMVG